MGVEKAEIKMAVAHELGAGFDDALESAQQDIYRWDGAKTSLKSAVTAVEALIAHAKRDLESEVIDEDKFVLVRKWLQRATEVVRNLRTQAEVHEQRAHGRVDAFKATVKITKKLYDSEEAKLKGMREHTEEEPDGEVPRHTPARPTGTRPPNLVAAKKAAEKAKKASDADEKPKKKKKKSSRKCGKCGEEGHTARTCKKKKS